MSRLKKSLPLLLIVVLLFLAPSPGQAQEHKFWDKKNLIGDAVLLSGLTFDAITTQNFRTWQVCSHNQAFLCHSKEANPLARPFVDSGWKGQATLSYGIGYGGTKLGQWILHKKGKHKAERLLPYLVAAPSFIAGGFNINW